MKNLKEILNTLHGENLTLTEALEAAQILSEKNWNTYFYISISPEYNNGESLYNVGKYIVQDVTKFYFLKGNKYKF